MSFKKPAIIIGTTGAISYASYKTISNKLFNDSFKKRKKENVVDQEYIDWFSNSKVEEMTINSLDGLKLYGYDIHNNDSNKYIIAVHGIWSNSSYMYQYGKEFDKFGYNFLLVDQRAAGKSQGKYYTYGFKESFDLLQWIDTLIEKYPDVQICLFGVSMGAATVMMSLKNKLPNNVKCVVEDCGFSSVKEEFDHVLKNDYKISFTSIPLQLLEKSMNDTFGINFEDINVKKSLDNNEIPILFIHGKKDKLVPYEMSLRLYNHNKGEKKFYSVDEAGHTKARYEPNYFKNVHEFISTYM